ncbi:SDR family oxidoreductase [Mycobacterium sp. AMU20-3851]|uniref:SDR family oxidoreductase n=1 Tax=Mycobacterium sp. AMU20-3851 TaxID=3122055 RepID=UPI00375488D6
MSDSRSVVITGASRGLGLASAAHLYKHGWQVVAAMRNPERGMAALQEATGAADDDERLIGVQLDLGDRGSIATAAKAIEAAVGAPYALVHNAGISAAGMVEEAPVELWESMFQTHILGPVALTQALLPGMRAAGRGRIVMVSSQGGVRGQPAIAAYSASKGALERWAESMAGEIAAFGIGVTVLVTGTFDTDIITDAGTIDNRDLHGPYARHHRTMDKRGRAAMKKLANPPEKFARGLARALEDTAPYRRQPIGPDARMLVVSSRLLPAAAMHQMSRLAMGLPRTGALRPGTADLTASQRAMIKAAQILPEPVMTRIAMLAMRFAPKHEEQKGSDA